MDANGEKRKCTHESLQQWQPQEWLLSSSKNSGARAIVFIIQVTKYSNTIVWQM
jgi:hypothetical protein